MHADPLVLRMVEGLGSNKYKPVDYTRLKALASEKKFASLKTSMKVNKIEKISRANKESSILKQHQLVWQKEFLRLQHLRRKVSTSVGPACGSWKCSPACWTSECQKIHWFKGIIMIPNYFPSNFREENIFISHFWSCFHSCSQVKMVMTLCCRQLCSYNFLSDDRWSESWINSKKMSWQRANLWLACWAGVFFCLC